MISAIILAYNEESHIRPIICDLKKQQINSDFEIILTDGGSTDNTVSIAQEEGIRIVACPKGKACQMNKAAKIARGDILFFVHADMRLQKNVLSSIINHIDLGYDGGGFSNVFDQGNQKIKKLGDVMNFRIFDKREQSDKGTFYGDNGIFVRKVVFDSLNGFKEIPIMEDYDFSMRLSKNHKVIKINEPQIILSARRHLKSGFLKTRLQWILIRTFFQMGINPVFLARWYKDVR